jgi:hypothetical protein
VVCCLETKGEFDPIVVGVGFLPGQMSGPQQGFVWFLEHMGIDGNIRTLGPPQEGYKMVITPTV